MDSLPIFIIMFYIGTTVSVPTWYYYTSNVREKKWILE